MSEFAAVRCTVGFSSHSTHTLSHKPNTLLIEVVRQGMVVGSKTTSLAIAKARSHKERS